ncbi:MAG: sulfur carrier protein ThiS [Rectinemataceae bacterium]|jgi:sulfur carrier protein
MITVRGKPMDWNNGLTVRDALGRIGYDLPIVVVCLDGAPVPRELWATTPVPDGADLAVFPMMAGG